MTTLISLLVLATTASAQDSGPEIRIDMADSPRGLGIGVVLGEPTGLSFALRPSERSAFQAHISWSLVNDRARANLDYLHTLGTIVPTTGQFRLPLYVGLGGTLGVAGDPSPWDEPTPWVGARVPFGLALHPNAPVEVFAEIAPVVYVLPETRPGMEGGLGVRAYF